MKVGRRRSVALALATIAILAPACGIALDKHPRSIETSISTTTTIDEETTGLLEVPLYYVLDDSVVPQYVRVSDGRPSTLLRELLKPLPKENPNNSLTSAIPSGTTLRSAAQRGTVLIIDLSTEFGNVVGVSRQRALAQIVLTVTQKDIIKQVRFRIDGEDIQVASPVKGDVSSVDDCDFKGLLGTDEQAIAGSLDHRAIVDVLDLRRKRLAKKCS